MPKPVEIPGGIAYLRDPEDMRERHRRLIRNAMAVVAHLYARIPADIVEKARGEGPEALDARRTADRILVASAKNAEDLGGLNEVHDAAILGLLERWTLSDPLPRSLDELQDLPPDIYEALSNAVAPQQVETITATMPVEFEVSPKKNSPFNDSGDSVKPLRRRTPGRARSSK